MLFHRRIVIKFIIFIVHFKASSQIDVDQMQGIEVSLVLFYGVAGY